MITDFQAGTLQTGQEKSQKDASVKLAEQGVSFGRIRKSEECQRAKRRPLATLFLLWKPPAAQAEAPRKKLSRQVPSIFSRDTGMNLNGKPKEHKRMFKK